VPVAIIYGELHFDEGFRADSIVEDKVILELKSIEQLNKVHAKQLFTYLKLKGLNLGFLLNFGANLMKDGIERIVNGLAEENLAVFARTKEEGSRQDATVKEKEN
jgi:GxxExxY protein